MAAYNSRGIPLDTWEGFEAFVRGVARSFGVKAWAACLEETLSAGVGRMPASADGKVYHLQAYFLWTGGVGSRARNIEAFVFANV